MSQPRVAILALLLALGAAVGCGGGAEDEGSVVARIDGEPIYAEEVRRYLRSNLADEAGGGATSDEVRSRLFDALILERLLAREAERRGLEVGEAELQAYLDLEGVGAAGEPAAGERRREEARRRILVQLLQEITLREVAPPAAAEVETWARSQQERLLPRQAVALRALLFESRAEAERVVREIRARRITFEEAVVKYEATPGQAQPLHTSLDEISDELRPALSKLRPGEVSQPLEFRGSWYLFQVEAWLRDPEEQRRELLRRARDELEERGRREALDRFERELRSRARVKIHAGRLAFRYLPER